MEMVNHLDAARWTTLRGAVETGRRTRRRRERAPGGKRWASEGYYQGLQPLARGSRGHRRRARVRADAAHPNVADAVPLSWRPALPPPEDRRRAAGLADVADALYGVGGEYADGYRYDYRAQYDHYRQIAQPQYGVYLVLYPPQKNRVSRLRVVRQRGQKK